MSHMIISFLAVVLATSALLAFDASAAPSVSNLPTTGLARIAHFSAASLIRRDHVTGSGEATYYDPGLRACEAYNGPAESIVALNAIDFGPAVPTRNSPACFSCVRITSPSAPNAAPIVAKVVDKCPGCSKGDLDLSPVVFQHFHDLGKGRFPVEWVHVQC
ncbi:RlpA-like double-psi beta-barrel-protein domain-containing protein-containing protein [Catenaria anguillulae PL171]|uniref:RlpA-like double-psi beta-barrel-protein domain-containing protein-containing protein n=1 Tax=Catenaria anguillulae PL171 TaxID=765915 RepID=A0A1Y2HGU5_9FUNG|nr:RlpA-like double-psi beta-barrel-protein domain-containing protein-containing protein [Catenaria anguillulae PL171]